MALLQRSTSAAFRRQRAAVIATPRKSRVLKRLPK